jgi:site-specific recombinase XerD
VSGPDALTRLLTEHESWLTVERGLAPNSLAAYRRDLRRYAAFLRARGITDPRTVGEDVVRAYVAELESARDEEGGPRFKQSSVARALVAVRSFHRFCVDEGVTTADPSETVFSSRVPQGIPKALTEAEVEGLLGAVIGDEPRAQRDRAILELLYGTGIRISELVGLDLYDVDLEDGMARVMGKGSKERMVPVGRSARRVLQTYLADGRRAVPQRPRGPPHPPRLLEDRAGRGLAGGARRPSVAPRPAPLLRHPHAGPRGRHPGGPGAARPRQHLHDPGVHEGLARAAQSRLRDRPPAGPADRPQRLRRERLTA